MGLIELDIEKIHELARLSNVTVHPQAHNNEHCLEVQLPFLQYLLDDFTLIPLVVGITPPAELYPLIDSLWNGPETLFIVSTDLSHYHSYQQAKTLDHATSQAILQLNSNITGEQACGCQALNGMLLTLQKKGLDITELDVRNSGDTAGSKEQVVGYGSYAFY
jgi:AmmeMemoRadiSam system protein B